MSAGIGAIPGLGKCTKGVVILEGAFLIIAGFSRVDSRGGLSGSGVSSITMGVGGRVVAGVRVLVGEDTACAAREATETIGSGCEQVTEVDEVMDAAGAAEVSDSEVNDVGNTCSSCWAMDTAAAAEGDTNRTGVDMFGTGGVQRGGSRAGVGAGLTASKGTFLGVDSGGCTGESGGV